MSDDGHSIDYESLKNSQAFQECIGRSRELKGVDVNGLDPDQKKAFFISILWHLSRAKLYDVCSIGLRPKVETEALYSYNLACVQIYSSNEYAESFCLFFFHFHGLEV